MAGTSEERTRRFIADLDVLAQRLRPKRRARDLGEPECSEQELRALNALGRQGRLTMGEVAAILGVPQSTATHTVDRLVAKGLVERRQMNLDRRIVHVAFSRRGKRINRFVDDSRQSAAQAMLRALPARELESLLKQLAKIAQGVRDQHNSKGSPKLSRRADTLNRIR